MLTSRISGCKGSANHENKQIYLNNSQMPIALKATKQTKTKQKTVKMLCSSDNNWQSNFNRCNAAFTAQSAFTVATRLSPPRSGFNRSAASFTVAQQLSPQLSVALTLQPCCKFSFSSSHSQWLSTSRRPALAIARA